MRSNSYAALGRPADALKLGEEALATQRRVLPKDDPDTLVTMHNLAYNYRALGRPADALKLYEELLEIQRRVLPKDDSDTLQSMTNLAISYAALGRPADAVKLFEEALAARKRALPKDHPDTLSSMVHVANSYSELNRYADALKLYEEALAARKRVLPKDHPGTLLNLAQVAETLVQLDRGAEALPLLDEVLAKVPDRPGVNARLIPHAISLRGTHFRKAGDLAGCRATAEAWEKLNRADADSLFNAACFRAVTSALQAKTPGADAARLARSDADRAMEWLTKAVAAGYKDAAHMKEDADLDPLRQREDFKKLIVELEKPPEIAPPPREKK